MEKQLLPKRENACPDAPQGKHATTKKAQNSRGIRRVWLTVLLTILCGFGSNVFAAAGTHWYLLSSSNGDITVLSNWTNDYTGATASGTLTTFAPGSGSTYYFHIKNVATATMGASLTIGSGGGTAVIYLGDSTDAVNFTVPAVYTLTNGAAAINVSPNATLTLLNTTVPYLGVMATGSTVAYSAAGSQNVQAIGYSNLVFGGSGTRSASTVVTVNTMLAITGTSTISGSPTYTSGSTLEYNTTSGYTAGYEFVSPYNVIVANTGAITLGMGSLAKTSLTINSGATLNTNNYSFGFGNFINNGTFNAGSSSISTIYGGVNTWNGFTTTGAVYVTGTCTVTLTGNMNAGSLVVTGSNSKLYLGTGLTHTTNTMLIGSGDTVVGGSSTLNLSGSGIPVTLSGTTSAFVASTGTVNYNCTSGSQSIQPMIYYNLKASGSRIKYSNYSATATQTTINNSLVINSSTDTFNLGNTLLIDGGSCTITNNGVIETSVVTTLSPTPVPVGKTWGGLVEYYSSSGSQTIVPGTYNSILTNYAMTLGGNVTTGSLSLNGILTTGPYTLNMSSSQNISSAGSSRYVYGNLSKAINGTSEINYEVGDATEYLPAELILNAPGTAGSLGVTVAGGSESHEGSSYISGTQNVNAYWSITNSGAAGPSTVTLKAYYNSGDITGGSNSSFSMQEYTSGSWAVTTIPCTNASGGSYSSTANSGVALGSVAGDYIFGVSNAPCYGTPAAGAAQLSPGDGGSASLFTASLLGATTASGLTYQWAMSTTSGSSGFSNITGATNSTYSFSGLTGNTWYECVLGCPSYSTSATSTSGEAIYFNPAASCTPSSSQAAQACSYSAYMLSFNLTGASGSISDAAPCNGTGYVDNITENCTLNAASTYTATITTGAAVPVSVQIWIDFNGDGIFQTSESVGGSASIEGAGNNVVLTIPAGVSGGTFRMRAVADYTGDGHIYPSMDPCTSGYSYSEGRDYSITIPGGVTWNNVAGVSVCVGNNVTLTDATSGGTWSSTNTSVATIGTDGTVNGVSGGTSTISYAYSGGGGDIQIVTVNGLPAAISGSNIAVSGASLSLSDGSAGGTWSSSNTSAATISSSGIVSGVVTGSTEITYSLAGCYTTMQVYAFVDGDYVYANRYTGNTLGVGKYDATVVCAGWESLAGSAIGVAVDNVHGKIYYTQLSAGQIGVINTDGTGRTDNLITGISQPLGITVDEIHGYIYYASNGSSKIYRANLDGTGNTVLITGQSSAYDVAVDPVNNKIYWCRFGSYNIGQANLDGTGVNASYISAGSGNIYGIGIDVPHQKVYWANYSTSSIGVANLDGSGINSSFITGVSGVRDVAVNLNHNKLFWTASGNIGTANLDGTGVLTSFMTGFSNAWGIDNGVRNTAPVITGAGTLCSSMTTTLNCTVAGGTWTSGSTSVATINGTTGVVTGVSGGTAVITYIINCTSATAIITINSSPSSTGATNSGPICLGSNVTLHDNSINATGWSWLGSDGSSSSSESPVMTPTATTTYSLTMTNTDGCINTTVYTTTASVNVAPSSTGATNSGPVCLGTLVTLYDNSTNATGWSWIGSDGSSSTLQSPTMTPSATTTYSLTVSNSDGCGNSTVYTTAVTVNAAPSSTGATNSGPVCAGTGVTLYDNSVNATGWSWQGSDGSSSTSESPLMTPTATTTYSLTLTNTDACTNGTVYTTTVTVNVAPSSTGATNDGPVCVGTGVTLYDNSANATGWSWMGSDGSSSTMQSPVMTPTATTTYSLTMTNTDGCSSATIYTTTVTVNPVPNAGTIAGLSSVTVGANISLSDAAGGGSWSSGNTSVATVVGGVVSGVAIGTSTISYGVTGSCGTVYATKIITVNGGSITSITGNGSLCGGTTTTLSNPTPGGTWSMGNLVATINGSTGVVTASSSYSGTATVTYTIGSVQTTTVITVNPNPNQIQVEGLVCQGTTTTLSDAAPGGVWSGSGDATISGTGTMGTLVAGATAGSATIVYTLPTGCGTSTTRTIYANPAPITGAFNLCIGGVTTLSDLSPTAGWYSSDTAIAKISGGNVTGVRSGTTTITFQTSAIGYCLVMQVVTVSAQPASISGNTGTVCPGSTVVLTDAAGAGAWTSSNTTVATISSTGTITGVAGGVTTVSYLESGTSGCIAQTIVTVNTVAAIAGSTAVCLGGTSLLSDATAGGTWLSGASGIATVSASGLVTGAGAGTASITYTTAGGCRKIAIVTVNNVSAAINGSLALCVGTTATLTDATVGGTWSMSSLIATVGSSSGLVTASPSYTGTATISYLSVGCTASAILTVNPHPSAIQGTSAECPGAIISLTDATAGGSWSVSGGATLTGTGAAATLVAGATAGTAVVSYALGSGCTATVTNTIYAGPQPIMGNFNLCVGMVNFLSDASPTNTWSSSNTAIATCAGGDVTGVSVGVATITFKTGAAGYCTTTQTITVNAMPVVTAINGPATISHAGSPVTISDAIAGGVWTSSNTGIIALIGSTGTMVEASAVSSTGSAVITYAVTIAGCTAKVTKTFSAAADAGHPGSATLLAGTTISLADEVATGTWTSSDNGIAVVDGNGMVTGIRPGNADITHECSAGDGATSITNVINVIVSAAPVAINVLPNPNKGTFTVKGTVGSLANEEVTLEVTDLMGQVIYLKKVTAYVGNLNETIVMNNGLANGMYILNVKSSTETKAFHFVVEQ